MEEVDVLILGAGPAGLSAAYSLLKAGIGVTILEKDTTVGGFMRSIRKGEFTVDLGYKHLYNRIPEVHSFWTSLLGDDLVPYRQRTGMLFDNSIFEKDRSFRGLRRGMPLKMLLSAFADLVKGRIKYRNAVPESLEDFAYARRGKAFTMIFSQGYDERIKGRKWSQLPPPRRVENSYSTASNFIAAFWRDARSSRSKQPLWHHPALGTGQIVGELEKQILLMGGTIYPGSEVRSISQKDGCITSVSARQGDKEMSFHPGAVISSLPVAAMAALMSIAIKPSEEELSFRRGVILVYLFLKCEARFPHQSLQVSSPEKQMSRITNYAAFGGKMVPEGKGCLCVEFFCLDESPLYAMSDQQLYDLAVSECGAASLLDSEDCFDHIVIRRPGADPATSWEDYITDPSRREAYRSMENCPNLYYVNRTGLDKSTYAGLSAAAAIISKDRDYFLHKAKPDISSPWQS